MKLPIGTEVAVFERDGFETDMGVVEGYDGNCILIKSKNHRYRIPKPRVEIAITAKGNSLEQYVV